MDEALLSQPTAQAMLAAGVPREEVLAGLRASSAAAPAPYASPAPAPAPAPAQVPAPSRASSFGTALPPGWEERFDPASGRKFYVDFVNKTTSWSRPAPVAGTPPAAVGQPPSLASYPQMSSYSISGIPEGSREMSTSASEPSASSGSAPAAAAPAPATVEEDKKKKGLFGWRSACPHTPPCALSQ